MKIITPFKFKNNKNIKSFIKLGIIFILFFIFISMNTLYSNNKKIKVCLCTVGTMENLYVKEYITHYKNLGYNHIYLYDNNDVNGEKFEDVIKEEIDSNFVSIINYRGRKEIQCIAYRDCYEKNNKNYDWLSFYDMDEFLEVKPHAKNIQEFLSNKRYKKCINIKINFLFYSDNELLHYDKRPLQERFTTALYNHGANRVIKIMVRGGLYTNYWPEKCTAHSSALDVYSCNSNGQRINHETIFNSPPALKYARLKHYYTKSTEEYLIKASRGSATHDIKWNDERKKYKYMLYFNYNKKTKEKEDLLKKLFNMTL